MRKTDRDVSKSSKDIRRESDAVRLPKTKKVRLVAGGEIYTLYSIGWIAVLTNKDPHTIRRYEWRQIIPKPLITTKDNQRWYLAEEVAGYSREIKATLLKPKMNIEHTDLRDRCWDYREKVESKLQHSIAELNVCLANEQQIFDYAKNMRTAISRHRIETKFAARLIK
jgi:DNA-binding transcriptional MerR regulator